MRHCHLAIDLAQYKANLALIRHKIPPTTAMMAVVKANAYGLGSVPMATAALDFGCAQLAVANLGEAMVLREAGLTAPILILSEPIADTGAALSAHHLAQVVYTPSFIEALSHHPGPIEVHLKIDTGMGRIGCSPDDALALTAQILSKPNLKLAGIMTHFSNADEPEDGHWRNQLDRFNQTLTAIQTHFGIRPLVHAANSDATLNLAETHFDMVRIGIFAYANGTTQLSAPIIHLKEVASGTPISYRKQFVTNEPVTIATIGCGYADGLPQTLSPGGQVLIRDTRYPIVGRICMDMFMVNLGQNPLKIARGDTAILWGKDQQASISLDEVSQQTGLSRYELLCAIDKPGTQKNWV
ncbi:MAG: alanine racemase [Candidatus Margulisiibacteriota bacterium]